VGVGSRRCRGETRVERNESRVGDTVDQRQYPDTLIAHGQWTVTAIEVFAGNERQAVSNKAPSKRTNPNVAIPAADTGIAPLQNTEQFLKRTALSARSDITRALAVSTRISSSSENAAPKTAVMTDGSVSDQTQIFRLPEGSHDLAIA